MPYVQFHDFINRRKIISPTVLDDIIAKSEVIEARKGDFILKEGSTPNHIWYIVSGSLRTMYYYKDKEVTSWLYNHDQLVTAYGSFYTRTSSYENIQCTEDSVLISITYDNLNLLYDNHPSMATFGRYIMEEMVSVLDYFYKGFMFMTAKEKYDLILTYFPDVTQRVNLGYIASFLGITQETLSRIRRK